MIGKQPLGPKKLQWLKKELVQYIYFVLNCKKTYLAEVGKRPSIFNFQKNNKPALSCCNTFSGFFCKSSKNSNLISLLFRSHVLAGRIPCRQWQQNHPGGRRLEQLRSSVWTSLWSVQQHRGLQRWHQHLDQEPDPADFEERRD